MKKIAIGTMMWRRHDVFKVWATCIHRLIKDFPQCEFTVVVVGSEGKTSEDIVKSNGFQYIECENVTGKKANVRLEAMRKLKPDNFIFCGSDDIISSEAFRFMLDLSSGYDEICTMTLHYFDTQTKRLILSPGYQGSPREGEPLAPWRMLKAGIVSMLGDPWHELPRNIDSGVYQRLSAIPHSQLCHSGKMIIDIKSPGNITPFHVVSSKPGVKELSRKELFKHFPKEEAEAIMKL